VSFNQQKFTKMFKRIIFLPALLLVFWLTSCKDKTNEVDYNPNVSSAKDYIRAEDAVLEIVNSFFKGVYDTAVINHGYDYIDACSVRMYPDQDSMIYNYGTVDRLCQDDKFRRGHFDVKFTGNIFDVGVTANIITDSLLVDDLPIETNMLITNLGLNSDNLQEYNLQVTSSCIYLPDTNITNYTSVTTNFILLWEEGWQTPEIHEDDIFLISGNASGLSKDQIDFSISIQEPLVNQLDCWWISSGTSQITVPTAEFPDGTIDYILEDGCHNEMNFYFNDNLFYDFIK
jgi:hypothetical protein